MTPSSPLPNPAQIQMDDCPRRQQRLFAALLVVSLFIASCFATGTPATRALFAFIPIAVLMVIVEFCANTGNKLRNRERWRIRRTQITSAELLSSIANMVVHAIIACIALLILLQLRNPDNLTSQILRLSAGAALLYALVAIIATVITLLFLAAGYSLPLVHRHPVAARSVEEFWARRWNIVVSAWLHAFVFLPLARRRRVALGIMLAFLVSGAMHGWLILLPLGAWPAFTSTLFFVVQGVAVLAENRLHIQTWPTPLAHVWTVIIVLGTSPLFIDPGLRLFGL